MDDKCPLPPAIVHPRTIPCAPTPHHENQTTDTPHCLPNSCRRLRLHDRHQNPPDNPAPNRNPTHADQGGLQYQHDRKEKRHRDLLISIRFIKTSGPSTFAEQTREDSRNSILGGRIDKLRLAAIHNALKDTTADRLLDPQYDCKVVTYPFGLFKRYTVTVKGYEATIKEIHQTKN